MLLPIVAFASLFHGAATADINLRGANHLESLVSRSLSRNADINVVIPRHKQNLQKNRHSSLSQESISQESPTMNQQMMNKLIADKIRVSSYDKDMRPIPDKSVFDGTNRIKVFVGLQLRKLLGLDPIKQTMTALVWLRVMWPDYRLKYNAAEYFKGAPMSGGKPWNSSTMFIPVAEPSVWVPDLQVLNAVEKPEQVWSELSKPRVFWYDQTKLAKEGYNMVLVTPQIVHVACPMELKEFPFDQQMCEMPFGSSSAGDQYFELDSWDSKVEHQNLPEANDFGTEFAVESLPVEHKVIQEDYLLQSQGVPTVSYKIKLTRRPHYYLLNLVLPMSLLVLLGQALYWMDLRKERLSAGMTVVLAVMAVGFLTEGLTPKTSEVLWIDRFQAGCYVLTCIPMFWSIMLDHCKTQNYSIEDRSLTLDSLPSVNYSTEEQAEKADSYARIVHPLVVLLFFCIMFAVPSVHYWPLHIPEIAIFFSINVVIYLIFFISALAKLECFKKYVPNDDDNNDRSARRFSISKQIVEQHDNDLQDQPAASPSPRRARTPYGTEEGQLMVIPARTRSDSGGSFTLAEPRAQPPPQAPTETLYTDTRRQPDTRCRSSLEGVNVVSNVLASMATEVPKGQSPRAAEPQVSRQPTVRTFVNQE